MYKIFTLYSVKYILSIEDLLPPELKIYKWYLTNQGLSPDNLFKNVIGSNFVPFNSVNRYMYRIRYWVWYNDNQYYKLMDIDNYGNSHITGEHGIIAFNDEPFLINDSGCLFFVPFTSTYSSLPSENKDLIAKFSKNLQEFHNVRRVHKVTSSLIKTEIRLYKMYKKLLHLSNSYINEFKLIGTLSYPNDVICNTFLQNFKHKIDSTYDIVFVKWNFRGIDFNLVTVKNQNDSSTYFCDDKHNILKYNYINPEYPNKNILDKFRKRVYSFLVTAKIIDDTITYKIL